MFRSTFDYYLVGIFVIVTAQPDCQPPSQINCDTIVSFNRCLGHEIIDDCTEKKDAYYWRMDNHLSWDDAKTVCRSVPGADLVSIHSFDELEVLKSLWSSRRNNRWIWVGLQCPQPTVNCQSNEYSWTDGTPIDYNIPWLSTVACRHAKIESVISISDLVTKMGAANNPQTIQTKAVLLEYNPSNYGHADYRRIGICPYPGDQTDISTVCKLKY